VDAGKAREIIGQIESREARIEALRRMAAQKAKSAEAASLLEKATQEALAMEGLSGRISALRGVAADWAGSDPGKAKGVFQLIFQAAEKADPISPKTSGR
jgi:hypothetical protein